MASEESVAENGANGAGLNSMPCRNNQGLLYDSTSCPFFPVYQIYVVCPATCPRATKNSNSNNMPFILFLILILLILGSHKETIIAIINKLWPSRKQG